MITMRKYCYSNLLLILILLILNSCANRSYPSGGPGDIRPPRLLSASPESGVSGFPTDGSITLLFDKWIFPGTLRSGINISPMDESKPQFTVRRNRVTINPANGWSSDQTYIVTLTDGLQDYSKNRLHSSKVIVFSTGNDIATSSASGYIKTDSKQQTQLRVGLYRLDSNGLFNPLDHPLYSTQPDSNGFFSFNWINDGEYGLIAFHDRQQRGRLIPGDRAYFSKDYAISTSEDRVHILHEASADTSSAKAGELKLIGNEYIRIPISRVELLQGIEIVGDRYKLISAGVVGDDNIYKIIPPLSDSSIFEIEITAVAPLEEISIRDTIKVDPSDSTIFEKQEITSPRITTDHRIFPGDVKLSFSKPIKGPFSNLIIVKDEDSLLLNPINEKITKELIYKLPSSEYREKILIPQQEITIFTLDGEERSLDLLENRDEHIITLPDASDYAHSLTLIQSPENGERWVHLYRGDRKTYSIEITDTATIKRPLAGTYTVFVSEKEEYSKKSTLFPRVFKRGAEKVASDLRVLPRWESELLIQ